MRGVVAAMCMSGVRSLTVRLGLLKRTPPEMVVDEYAGGMLDRIPENRREAAVELLHWAYGAVGGAAFGVLPDRVRLLPWAGSGAVAPVRSESRSPDHLLYGAVLAELRRRPQH